MRLAIMRWPTWMGLKEPKKSPIFIGRLDAWLNPFAHREHGKKENTEIVLDASVTIYYHTDSGAQVIGKDRVHINFRVLLFSVCSVLKWN